ncbi:MAG: molybdopterin-dependent oxidoreductase [Anaerolineae bacterium]|nr:molybdopterin-dependent oxidoreductase [Anaerolineae bacterium]
MSLHENNTLTTVNFWLNNEILKAVAPADMTLLDFLRDKLHLTGTKNGCSTGHCGACTVILNGKAARACLVKMQKLEGAYIETIEGLSKNGQLHPIQQAFIETGAVQCGFCTPGMILSAKALLDAVPQPTTDQIKQHLTQNKNLCRCTGYIKIIEAIQLASQRMVHAEAVLEKTPEHEQIDHSLRTADAIRMVTGKTIFGDDIYLDGMLHGKILWSAHPHAEILSMDTSEAESVEGVVCIVTAKDIRGKNQAGIIIRDQPAIADKKVRYIGDSLAAVFAYSPEIAKKAVEKIKVEYRILPAVFSPEEASRPDAPLVQEKGNLLHHAQIIRGDVGEAFKKCAVISEHDYTTPAIEHGFLEPESGIAYPTEDGGVVLKIGTQTAFDDRTQLSEILGLPEEKIRVIQIPMGGAFGAKEDMILQQYLALGALKSGRPVKMVLSREESLRVHVKRHPAWMHYKTGADPSGKVLAIEASITLDTGCYCSLGLDILENVVVFGAGPYYVPNLKIEGKSWYTNNVPSGAMRGFGVNQVAIALEQQFDEMANALGIDPFEFRLINALDVGLPTASDHIMTEGVVSIKQTIAAARDAFKAIEIPSASNGKKIGWGVASAVKNIGFGHAIPESAGAIVEMDKSGHVVIKASQHEYGQGAQVGLVKLAMNALNIPAEKITYIGPDTALTPPTGPTTASRQTFLSGNAVVMACKALKEELTSRAAEMIECEPQAIQIVGSRLVNPETGKSVELEQLGERFVVEKTYIPPESVQMHPVGEPSHIGQPDFITRPTHWCYAYNTQVAIVEVDTLNGEVKVLKIISANDVGKVLNYDAVVGQIHGGVMMGVGFALSEQFVIEKGVNLTDSLHKCRLPLANMVPEIIPVIVEVPHPLGPQGVKGFAEAPSLATAPAILNAIYNAAGIRIRDLPADRKRVKEALDYAGL